MKDEWKRYPRALWPMLKAARAQHRREFQAQYRGVNPASLKKPARAEYDFAKACCAYPWHIKDSAPNYHAPVENWVGAKPKRAA